MKKINQYFFGVSKISFSDILFFYGTGSIVFTVLLISLYSNIVS